MPYTDGLPFTSGPGSHCSYLGAKSAAHGRAAKSKRYLRYLSVVGPSTDQDAAVYLGWALSSVNSIRNGLMAAGLVERGEMTRGTRQRFKWHLTDEGKAAARVSVSEAT
jgi:DNA-binding MarR family transcriptional regulator